MPATPNTMISTDQILIDEANKTVLMGISLRFDGKLSSRDAVQHIQDAYFDALPVSGQFRLMPQAYKQHASFEYLNAPDSLIALKIPERLLATYDPVENCTCVDILLGQCDGLSESLQDELQATMLELDLFVASDELRSWQSFSLAA